MRDRSLIKVNPKNGLVVVLVCYEGNALPKGRHLRRRPLQAKSHGERVLGFSCAWKHR